MHCPRTREADGTFWHTSHSHRDLQYVYVLPLNELTHVYACCITRADVSRPTNVNVCLDDKDSKKSKMNGGMLFAPPGHYYFFESL